MKLQPYKFRPLLKSVIWGGERIQEFKHITTGQHQVGESWEVSGVEGNESVVDGGPDDGLTLSQLIGRHGADLVGERVYRLHGTRFPLLIKLIDAHRDLSLQVHPDDAMAQRVHGSSGKTEMWYVIDHEPGAQIMAGFSQAITPEQYDRRVADGTIMDVVAHHTAHRGQVFFLPAGRIHAIGAGNFIAEIQQTSDITYRVFDYNRVDSSGQKRPLHTQLAREALDFSVTDDCAGFVCPKNDLSSTLVSCDYFVTDLHHVESSLTLTTEGCFRVIICVDGSVDVVADGVVTALQRGQTILVPACLEKFTLTGRATLLATHC